MKKIEISPKLSIVIALILAGVMMRLIPHWPNFTPIASIALFGGTFLKRKELAFLVPIAAMLLSDLIIGFHSTMFPVYISFILIVGIGLLIQRKLSIMNVLTASLSSSLLFFLITNFASWTSGLMPYSNDLSGLFQAYIAGIPFFLNGIAGDLFYSALLFGSLYFITNRQQIFAR